MWSEHDLSVPQRSHQPPPGHSVFTGPRETKLVLSTAELCLLALAVTGAGRVKRLLPWHSGKWRGLHCPVQRQFEEIWQSLGTPGQRRRSPPIHSKVDVKILIIPHTENGCYHNLLNMLTLFMLHFGTLDRGEIHFCEVWFNVRVTF